MTTYAYARVSSRDQNAARQLDAFAAEGIDNRNVFVDHRSGRDFDRPAWREVVGILRAGDQLVVTSLDRLGRNYEEVREQWRHLVKEVGADVRVLDMPLLDTRRRADGLAGAFVADIVLQLLAYVAQAEREAIHVRQAEGIAAARRRGVAFGRPRLKPPRAFAEVAARVRGGSLSIAAGARRLKMAESTFRALLRREGPWGLAEGGREMV